MRVTLNSNTHPGYARDGEPLAATPIVTVEEFEPRGRGVAHIAVHTLILGAGIRAAPSSGRA